MLWGKAPGLNRLEPDYDPVTAEASQSLIARFQASWKESAPTFKENRILVHGTVVLIDPP